MEIKIKKEKAKTLTSPTLLTFSPEEEDYISVHIRVFGDFPINLARPVGCGVDGPFGNRVLIGADIGVTRFASILKPIWYRMDNFNNAKRTRLSKVYFTRVIRDFGSVEAERDAITSLRAPSHFGRPNWD
ncbi:hypothetical protein BU17DRAFT_73035 [Hysterangium stoloniferum]|nr:hypothetical protein BU17DRAFT_73035 [Hysterangium stoloniferum]